MNDSTNFGVSAPWNVAHQSKGTPVLHNNSGESLENLFKIKKGNPQILPTI